MPVSPLQLKEAYTLNSGAINLTPKLISRALLEYTRKYTPLNKLLPRSAWLTDTYFFNQRTGLPTAQMTTEGPSTTDVAASNSTYKQLGYVIKHMQSQLDISNFAAQVATVNGNLFDLEVAGSGLAMAFLQEVQHLYGAAAATLNTKRPQWDGMDMLIPVANKIDAAGALLSLSVMDNAIDTVESLVAQELGDNWMFVFSPRMQTRINALFINQTRYFKDLTVFSRDDYGVPGNRVVDNTLDGGVDVQSYRGVPLIKSSFMASVGTMGGLTVADAGGSGSSLTAQAYYYVVEAVSNYGVSVASAEGSVTPTSGHNISVTWSTPTITDALGNSIPIISYRVFRSNTSGTETLYAVVSARNTTDVAVTVFTDTGLPVTPSATDTTDYWQTVATSSTNAAPDGATYPRSQATGQLTEDIFLIPRDPDMLMVPVVNEMRTKLLAAVNARTSQIALISDMTLALRAGSFAVKITRARAS
jgi:hypothetical protein